MTASRIFFAVAGVACACAWSAPASAADFHVGVSFGFGRHCGAPVVYDAPVYYSAPVRYYHRAPVRRHHVVRHYYAPPVRHYRYVRSYTYKRPVRSYYYGGHSYRRHGHGRSAYHYRYYRY
jgi:hypothetical protein